MIPKVIHYCWFGGKPLPELAIKCIESWKKFCPDYEIKQWDESNFDINQNSYISEAYNAKKFAFVSDFARFDILYRYGGIYLDTDVEIIKDLSPIILNGAFAGTERIGDINSGLGIGAEAGLSIYKEILDSYKETHFIQANGEYDLTTVVTRVSDIFIKHGYKLISDIQTICGVTIYPNQYFCPKDLETGILKITDNTYTIHHFDASWNTPLDKEIRIYSQKITRVFGKNIFSKVLCKLHNFRVKIHYWGMKKTLNSIFKK